jgi:transcriptional regulator with XRE-family HTH domain
VGAISLRAFSQKVGFSNSYLSEVLSGKKSLSVEGAFKIAIKLVLTEAETQYLCLLVQLENEKDPVFREELTKRLETINPNRKPFDLSVDLYQSHFGLASLRDFGISKVDAELAIERLKRLELLEQDRHGRYKKAHNYIVTQSQIPNEALKSHHKQILEKAIECLDTQKPKDRLSATDIVAIDSKYLPEIDRLSREFSAAVMKLAEKSTVKDRVNALSVHCFSLTECERT